MCVLGKLQLKPLSVRWIYLPCIWKEGKIGPLLSTMKSSFSICKYVEVVQVQRFRTPKPNAKTRLQKRNFHPGSTRNHSYESIESVDLVRIFMKIFKTGLELINFACILRLGHRTSKSQLLRPQDFKIRLEVQRNIL